ncbi:unnamed protein product [Ranitomeya imitator]|uniref:Uncharacterized protein n=1 Tax=Ranitomeya imitator TaxID=111125 RepID=A0ABN9KUF7_9NEOB|nr:unnamed protein product [Ranitomeya imitator]
MLAPYCHWDSLETDLQVLGLIRKSVRSVYTSGLYNLSHELPAFVEAQESFVEALQALGSNQLSTSNHELTTGFLNLSVLSRELGALFSNMIHNLNSILSFPVDSLLRGDLKDGRMRAYHRFTFSTGLEFPHCMESLRTPAGLCGTFSGINLYPYPPRTCGWKLQKNSGVCAISPTVWERWMESTYALSNAPELDRSTSTTKNIFSVVLMAIADADCRFIAVDFGAFGRGNDSDFQEL